MIRWLWPEVHPARLLYERCRRPWLRNRPRSHHVSSLSVIVPCYNHRPYLPRAIESLERQTRLPDEIIFVDDAATDSTAELLRSVEQQGRVGDARVTVVTHPENQGQARAINTGARAATSDILMVVNDDDYLLPTHVEQTVRFLNAYPTVQLVGGHSRAFDGDDQIPELMASIVVTDYRDEPDLRRPHDSARYRRYDDLNVTHSGCAFSKWAWEQVGGYRPRKERVVPFSDRDFQLRVAVFFPVAAVTSVSTLWRSNSSVDQGVFS